MRTIVPSRGSRAARSNRLISVGWRSQACPSASWESLAFLRSRRTFRPKVSCGDATRVMVRPYSQKL